MIQGGPSQRLLAANPEQAGMDRRRVGRVEELLWSWTDSGEVPGLALLVARSGIVAIHQSFGFCRACDAAAPCHPNTIFLVASLAKPITGCAVMLLVERGLLSLDDPVCAFVPEFLGKWKEAVTLRHLLTHTSGLPDMLPQNDELRQAHAPLPEFLAGVCALELDFEPGTNAQYQSMGYLLLGEVVKRVTGTELRDFVQTELFGPLGMRDSFLGLREDVRERITQLRLPEDEQGNNWNRNSEYWRSLGAPWGGLHSTAWDLGIFYQMLLNGGAYGDVRILGPATVAAMTANHIAAMPRLPDQVKLAHPHGLGLALRGPAGLSPFGELTCSGTFGHAGVTGCVAWADPQTKMVCVFLSNQPVDQEARRLALISNAVAACNMVAGRE